jgi:hypothetical protein
VVKRGATVVQEVPAPGSELVTDLVDGELCYTVQAKLGDQVSEDSDTSCLDPAETGTAGPTGGPVDPENLGVVATPFGPGSLDDPSGLAVAQQNLSSLRADHNLENVAIIVSSDYSRLQPPLPNASYLVVITGFSSDREAYDRCSQLGLTCTAYTPGPPNETAAPPITLPP